MGHFALSMLNLLRPPRCSHWGGAATYQTPLGEVFGAHAATWHVEGPGARTPRAAPGPQGKPAPPAGPGPNRTLILSLRRARPRGGR